MSLSSDWKPIATASLAALGAIWTAVEVVDWFLQASALQKPWLIVPFLGVAGVLGVKFGRRPKGIAMRIPGTDTNLKITEGDLFDQKACQVISVNEFFDTSMPDHVSPTSLHGRFLTRHFEHREAEARSRIDAALGDAAFSEVVRSSGHPRCYPIGTVAEINEGGRRTFLVALARSDPDTLQASATTADLHQALTGLWKVARARCGGEALALPLIGSGLARIGLPTRQLLDIIIGSIVIATKEAKITGDITIVLRDVHLSEVDLRDIQRAWGR